MFGVIRLLLNNSELSWGIVLGVFSMSWDIGGDEVLGNRGGGELIPNRSKGKNQWTYV